MGVVVSVSQAQGYELVSAARTLLSNGIDGSIPGTVYALCTALETLAGLKARLLAVSRKSRKSRNQPAPDCGGGEWTVSPII